MNSRQALRLVVLYYILLSIFLLYTGVIIPINEIVIRFSNSLINSIPVIIIPSGIVICLLILMIHGLLQRSSWSFKLSVGFQCIAILFSLAGYGIHVVFGSVLSLVNGLVLLVLLAGSVESEMDASSSMSEGKAKRKYSLLNRIIGTLLVVLCLSLISWCVISEYTAQTMSGYRAMLRLTGATNGRMSRDEIRLSLLQKVPLGTTKAEVISYLETNGIPEDRFVGGQFVRYQIGNQYILALFSTPPWVLHFICSQDHNGVRFIFDQNEALKDILIENYSVCL